jgi:hypothetical protein
VEALCREWKRAFPVPSGSWESVGLVYELSPVSF